MAISDLFKTMTKGFRDDKGLFQGGEEGRMLGRVRDRMGGRGASYDPSMAEDQDLWAHAKDFASNIDTESSDDVLELQALMNRLGITDEGGASFKEDAILGSKTMQGLRQLQGSEDRSWREGPYAPEEPVGSAPKSWLQKLFPGRDPAQSARQKMFNWAGPNTYQRKKNPNDDKAGPGY